jgi:hypothetical protein
MHHLILAALLLQAPAARPPADAGHDTSRNVAVRVTGVAREDRARRAPVTPEHLRTAFHSEAARTMLMRARSARLEQDSALTSYEATAYLRISAGMGFARIGRDRLIFRHEKATSVRWHRDVGAWIEVKGARTHLPTSAAAAEQENADMVNDSDLSPVPYYPGYEPLFSFNGGGIVRANVDERDMVHPIAEGAEAYYTYASGDSVVFRLPTGRSIRLRELLVRPRESRWNVAVGSLWFDMESGQLVRAAYRLAVPMDVWAIVKEEDPQDYEEIPVWVRPMISPMHARVTAIGVEYGLYEGRFWLPRLRTAEGSAQVSFMRVPFAFQQSFRYGSVNALESLPAIVVPQRPQPPAGLDSAQQNAWRDSVRQVQRQAVRDSIRLGLRSARPTCDSTGTRVSARRRQDVNMSVAMRVPCDARVLATAPELPPTIYDDGEELFGSAELDALKREALRMGAQPPLAAGRIPPVLRWGLEFTRFNRVEGLSTGARLDQPLGGGYTTSLLARLGHADLHPNAELSLSRSNLSRALSVRGYRRLVAANDWGNPLSFGSSLSALLFGRDEGFYYRATGAELEWARDDRASWSYRAFAEQHRTAVAERPFSLGAAFIPNIEASNARYAGASARFLNTRGLNPDGFRVFTDLRLEGAASDSAGSAYGRGALDLTLTQGLGRGAMALTVSGGSSAGSLPPQRRWYLGGAHTVRGQFAAPENSGDAYWLARVELGGRLRVVRPVVFGDLGWVGDRSAWRRPGRPLSGAGVGASLIDGLVRLDASRGINPGRRIRLDMYVEARF